MNDLYTKTLRKILKLRDGGRLLLSRNPNRLKQTKLKMKEFSHVHKYFIFRDPYNAHGLRKGSL